MQNQSIIVWKFWTLILTFIEIIMWNQDLVNLSFDDNKTRFWTNIMFQVWLGKKISKVIITKTKSRQEKINKKKKTSKRSSFQDPNFIRSLCKVVGALGFSRITFFTYAPKSSKSFFILNPLKLDDFMFSTKTLCQMFSKLV